MKRRTMSYVLAVTGIAALSYLAWKMTSRTAYESAGYTVVETDGAFEVRDYPELLLATTEMEFSAQGNDGSFMRLFRYISGQNAEQQKVAMTTPVFMQRPSGDSSGQMAFVLPRQVAESRIPEPTSDAVSIGRRAGGRWATIRFNGRISGRTTAEKEQQLRSWMARNNLIAGGDAEVAGYDAPWTPGLLRRNEVLIRIADRPDGTGESGESGEAQ